MGQEARAMVLKLSALLEFCISLITFRHPTCFDQREHVALD
ncbi:hypothetical protein Nmel_009817 [Mimus melanotis]